MSKGLQTQTEVSSLFQKEPCNCVLSDDPGPTPVCELFDRDEEGYCFTCGHAESCHVE